MNAKNKSLVEGRVHGRRQFCAKSPGQEAFIGSAGGPGRPPGSGGGHQSTLWLHGFAKPERWHAAIAFSLGRLMFWGVEAFLCGLDTWELHHNVAFLGCTFDRFKVPTGGQELRAVFLERGGDAYRVLVILRLVALTGKLSTWQRGIQSDAGHLAF